MMQLQLAEKIGLAKSFVSAYETGIRHPSYGSLVAISHIFQVSTDYLLGIEDRNQDVFLGMNENEVNALMNFIKGIRKKTLAILIKTFCISSTKQIKGFCPVDIHLLSKNPLSINQ